VETAVSGLERGDRREGRQVRGKSRVNNAFKGLRDEVEVGDWAIARIIISRKVEFLENGCDKGMFEGGGKET
jgi:hypothetical protein